MKAIPLLSELYNNIKLDLIAKLGLTDAAQLKMVNNAFAAVEAGQFKLTYLYLADIQRNLSPDTADPESQGGQLNRYGQLRLNRQPFPPTDGIFTASVNGVAGSVLREQLTFKSNDDSKSPGNLYILASEYILTGTDDLITIRSLNAGLNYLLAVGDRLTPTEPVVGVDDGVVITAVTQQPTAAEDIELYRQRVKDSYRLMPQGGARTDYRLWSADVPGVQRVYPYVKNGDGGVVQIFVEATVADSIDGYGTPGSPILVDVEEAIEFSPDTTLPTNYRGRRPGQAIPEVQAITIVPVDVTITGLEIDNSAVRAAINTNLVDFLFDIRPFIAGVDLREEKNNVLTAVKLQSVISDTIGTTNSFTGFGMSVEGVLTSSYTFALGNIPYLRNLIYA